MNTIMHDYRLIIPDITETDDLPAEAVEDGKLKRSVSFEFSARDWNGNGYLVSRGLKLRLWNYMYELSEDIAKLDEELAASNRDLEQEDQRVADMRNKCVIEAADAKLRLDTDRADELDENERRLEWTEKKEKKVMYQLKDCLNELKEVKRELRSLEAEVKEGAARGTEKCDERGSDQDDVAAVSYGREDRRNGKDPGYQNAVSYGGEVRRNGEDPGYQNAVSYGGEVRRNGKDPGYQIGAGEVTQPEMSKLAVARDLIDEDDGGGRGQKVGCFSFLRSFVCCKRKRRKKHRPNASSDTEA